MSPADGPPHPRPELAVGGIVVDSGRLLLVRRGRGPGIGRWSVPGGRVETGETLDQAVEREIWEETSLRVRCGPLVGWVERIGPDHHFVIMDFSAELVGPREVTAGDDAAEVAWVPLVEVTGYALVDGLEGFLRDHGVI